MSFLIFFVVKSCGSKEFLCKIYHFIFLQGNHVVLRNSCVTTAVVLGRCGSATEMMTVATSQMKRNVVS